MERVSRGERYWAIRIFAGLIETFSLMELGQSDDEAFFATGNYFATHEEAEACARKLRAVLKGADVIEMPSEEEMDEAMTKQRQNYKPMPDHIDYSAGFWDAVDYLKSKIVK